jgi:hypothetical protein
MLKFPLDRPPSSVNPSHHFLLPQFDFNYFLIFPGWYCTMEDDELVIIENEMAMRPEADHPAHPFATIEGRMPNVESLNPPSASSQASEVFDGGRRLCGGCNRRDTNLMPAQGHGHSQTPFNEADRHENHLVSERLGPLTMKHMLPEAHDPCCRTNATPIVAHPPFQIPHRIRDSRNEVFNGIPEFSPPVSSKCTTGVNTLLT